MYGYMYDYVSMYLCMQPWVQLQKANNTISIIVIVTTTGQLQLQLCVQLHVQLHAITI